MKKPEAVTQLSIMAHRYSEAKGLIREIRDVLESTATGCETMDSVRYGIFMKVNAERDRQDRLWGTEEMYPYRTALHAAAYPEIAAVVKKEVNRLFQEGGLTWVAILLEEVYEAIAAETDEDREEELVQVMAVCAKIIEKMKAGKIPEGEVL